MEHYRQWYISRIFSVSIRERHLKFELVIVARLCACTTFNSNSRGNIAYVFHLHWKLHK